VGILENRNETMIHTSGAKCITHMPVQMQEKDGVDREKISNLEEQPATR
jgi:hypothetical protein